MKKIFTLVAAAVMALAANAKDYTDELSITLNGEKQVPSEASITVTPVAGSDGLYDIMLNQFSFSGLLIGDVAIEDVKCNDTDGMDGYAYFEPLTKDAAITNGSIIAKYLKGKVTVTIREGSKMNEADNKLYLIINLPVIVEDLGWDYNVDAVFGNGGYQINNSGFENFHTATYKGDGEEYSSEEPNAWHSFNSGVATGEAAGFTKLALQYGSTSVSEEVRPGSLGKKSVLIKSSYVIISPANGTMTTGQMQAGSLSPTNAANCAFLDFENEEVDGNGDPFYTVLNGKPDALTVWVKFKQPEDLGEYKYATVSAVITDGTRYQDPEDKTYTNVVAKAQNKTIESKNFEWQELTIPFYYDPYASNNAEAKAILVTISTNATPGKGSSDKSNPDLLYVDDIALVYNAGLESLSIKGTGVTLEEGKTSYEISDLNGELTLDDIVAVSDGKGAYVKKTIEATDGGALVTITVTSNDYQTVNTWTVSVKGVTTGIDKVETTTENGVQAIYTIDGRMVNSMDAKGIYIVRKADGTTVKVLKK